MTLGRGKPRSFGKGLDSKVKVWGKRELKKYLHGCRARLAVVMRELDSCLSLDQEHRGGSRIGETGVRKRAPKGVWGHAPPRKIL